MPILDEMKKSFTRGRSMTPRSGSPVCKSPPPDSKVALLQERIQEKIRRSNSDLSPRPSASFRSRYGLSGIDASRIIHTVRSSSSQTIRRSRSSFIPIRSRETSVEKLRVSSPELMSPREVKKAMQGTNGSTQQHHRLSIKLEVVKGPSSSLSKKGSPEGKKSGLKKSTSNGKSSSKSSSGNLNKPKSVKISDKVSVENNHYRTVTSISNKNGGNGTNGSAPVKPPRKIKTGRLTDSGISVTAPAISLIDPGGKVHKISKQSPVAARHAGCLSPHNASRPTSPGSGVSGGGGGGPSSLMSVSNSSLNNITGGAAGTTKTSSSFRKKDLATSAGTKGVPGKKLTRESGGRTERKQGNGTNRISLSVGKDDRKSPEKEKQQQQQKSSNPASKSGMGLAGKQKGSSGGGGFGGSEVMVGEFSIRRENKSSSNIDLRCFGGGSTTTHKRDHQETSQSRYWTIPPRKLRRDIQSLERPSAQSLFSFRSLPALTPYLTETKRVSQSMFLARQQLPMVRPTKTSAMREKLAHDPPADGSTTLKSAGVRSTARSSTRRPIGGDGDTGGGGGGRIIRSVSCLTLKEKLIRDYTYTNYILELQHARKRSPRFLQLHRLYSSLERLGQLERSTSLYDIPVLSSEKQLDFDAWWKVRNRLRVEEEMSSIMNQLMNAQRNREFFFRPKSPEQLKWRGDSALRCKQWNIDELRHFLLTGELLKSKHTSASDLHKTAWRGTSVKEVALNMEVASSLSKTSDYYYYRDKHADYTRMPALRRAFSMSSTLSDDQKEKIKSRLGTLIVRRDNKDKERSGSKAKSGIYNTISIPTVRTSRMGIIPPLRNTPSPLESDVGIDGSLTETAKRQLSKTISEEVHERKMKEKAEQEIFFQQKSQSRVVEGSTNSGGGGIPGKSSTTGTSGESESDSSLKTVIHIPISTKMLLRKCQEQQHQNQQHEGTKGKTPVYPVYCTKGVPSKVSFFETFHNKDSNNNKEPVSEAKIIKTKSYPEKARMAGEMKMNKENSKNVKENGSALGSTLTATRSSRPKSPAFIQSQPHQPGQVSEKRSRSATPEKSIRASSPLHSSSFDNKYMSHINVISKLASLLLKKDNSLKSLVRREVLERDRIERLRMINAGEVDRLKLFFEDYASGGDFDSNSFFLSHPEVSLLRCLFCSDPNLARLTDKINLGRHSLHNTRRCASADIFKEKLDYFEKGDRIRPDGKESSPVHSRSPELYFSSRSRKPIYQPSSTPNICQPTLTAHCFLESPTKSMEFDTSCYSSDFSGNYWDYHSSTSPAPSSNAAMMMMPPYSPPPQPRKSNNSSNSKLGPGPVQTSTPITSGGGGGVHGLPANPPPNRETVTYATIQPRILESRIPPHELGKSWNFDPALHQPKYRYVPQPPIIEPPPKQYYSPHYNRIGSSLSSLHQPTSLPTVLPPPPIPPPPGTTASGSSYYQHHYHHPSTNTTTKLQKSESFHVSSSTSASHSHLAPPQMYRSIRYWNPSTGKGGSVLGLQTTV